ncbi:RNA polymerase sigma factor (sigma-70 family) [Streptomyces sp. TLI_235]|nr:sigma-70 family RNA polymerase sigma factor [Streptomyces sp. TLI_235]PBC75630.1 RNA polymerase sigma factor (sigma-70 family) [Streptomyces sp. TLI_235]
MTLRTSTRKSGPSALSAAGPSAASDTGSSAPSAAEPSAPNDTGPSAPSAAEPSAPNDAERGDAELSALSDAELAAALAANPTTTGGSRIREVMAEVFTRHHGAVLAYARRFCRDPQTAQDLAAEAYASTYLSVARGRGPRHAWRPYLKACVRRTAMEWSAQTTDRVLLPEDFHSWAEHLADEAETEGALLAAEEASLVAKAYRSLPERWQVLLWFFVVEGESAAVVAQRMSMTPSGVRSLAARARAGLREAYLRANVDEGTALECGYFTSLLTGAVRRPGRRRGRELARHLDECAGCGRVAEEFRQANRRRVVASPLIPTRPAAVPSC